MKICESRLAAVALVSVMAACSGPQRPPVSLPDEPQERLATCIAVEALGSEEGSPGAVSNDAFVRMLHLSLITATGPDDASVKSAALLRRGGELVDELGVQEYSPLSAPCRREYPAVYATTPVVLPADDLAAAACLNVARIVAAATIERDPALARSAAHIADGAERDAVSHIGAMNTVERQAAANEALQSAIKKGSLRGMINACAARFR